MGREDIQRREREKIIKKLATDQHVGKEERKKLTKGERDRVKRRERERVSHFRLKCGEKENNQFGPRARRSKSGRDLL